MILCVHMNTDVFKTLLEAEKAALEVQLARLGRKNPEVAGDWEAMPSDFDTDPADDTELGDKIEEMEAQNAVQNQLENRLVDIVRALEKIEAGTYGLCEVSGEEIESTRLNANPAARTSIANREVVL